MSEKEKPEKIIVFRKHKDKQWVCKIRGDILPGDKRFITRLFRVACRTHAAQQRLDSITRGQEHETV